MSAPHEKQRTPNATDCPQRAAEIQQILEALRGLQFGDVTIVVQDGVVVQIDRTEKRQIRGANK